MQKYELFLKHARVRAKKMREKCDFLLFLPEKRLSRLILVVNARYFAMSAKTKWRRSSQDFYRMASLAGTFEHLSSRISKIVHFLVYLCPLCKSPRLRAWVFLLKLSVSVFLQSC